MRAMLLAAGYGTRLKPLTNSIPKCLVPINGQPLLEIWLKNLSDAGIGPFLVNTHYLSEKVENFVKDSPYQKQVRLTHEPILLGTAGTLIANLDFFQGEDGLLIHADNYCLPDLRAFLKAHNERPKECLITMMTFRTQDPSSCGIVELNEKGVVIGFHEKVKIPPGNLANGAIYVLSSNLLSDLKKDVSDFSNEVLPSYIGRIFSFETASVFFDIGTPKAYEDANRYAIATY